jgi:hypothetical protein
MEYRVRYTVANYGFDADIADRVWQRLTEADPASEPIISGSTETGELSASFIVDASVGDAIAIEEFARACFHEALAQTTEMDGLWFLDAQIERENASAPPPTASP